MLGEENTWQAGVFNDVTPQQVGAIFGSRVTQPDLAWPRVVLVWCAPFRSRPESVGGCRHSRVRPSSTLPNPWIPTVKDIHYVLLPNPGLPMMCKHISNNETKYAWRETWFESLEAFLWCPIELFFFFFFWEAINSASSQEIPGILWYRRVYYNVRNSLPLVSIRN
jgi:hypothetical protein